MHFLEPDSGLGRNHQEKGSHPSLPRADGSGYCLQCGLRCRTSWAAGDLGLWVGALAEPHSPCWAAVVLTPTPPPAGRAGPFGEEARDGASSPGEATRLLESPGSWRPGLRLHVVDRTSEPLGTTTSDFQKRMLVLLCCFTKLCVLHEFTVCELPPSLH